MVLVVYDWNFMFVMAIAVIATEIMYIMIRVILFIMRMEITKGRIIATMAMV